MAQTGPGSVIASAGKSASEALSAALGALDIGPAVFAGCADEAIGLTRDRRPLLLISDLALPGGDGLHLAGRVLKTPMDRYPAIILMDPAGCAPVGPEWIFDCGVRLVRKATAHITLSETFAALSPEGRSLPPEKQDMLSAVLDDLGVPFHPGRQYLSDAAALAWMDIGYLDSLKGRLYAAVARKHQTDAARVERAMRYVIDAAWRRGEIDRQHCIFGDTIDARRGKPTCGEMIARLADILRWEGKE